MRIYVKKGWFEINSPDEAMKNCEAFESDEKLLSDLKTAAVYEDCRSHNVIIRRNHIFMESDY